MLQLISEKWITNNDKKDYKESNMEEQNFEEQG